MNKPRSIPPTNTHGYPLTHVEVKNRQSREWRRYALRDINRIDWNAAEQARALYAKVGGISHGKVTSWHYDYIRL